MKKILFAIVAVMALLFAGCSETDDTRNGDQGAAGSIIGAWELYKLQVIYDGAERWDEDWGSATDYRYIMQFRVDETFTLLDMVKESTGWETFADHGTYKITGNQIALLYDDTSVPEMAVIEKLTNDELILLYRYGDDIERYYFKRTGETFDDNDQKGDQNKPDISSILGAWEIYKVKFTDNGKERWDYNWGEDYGIRHIVRFGEDNIYIVTEMGKEDGVWRSASYPGTYKTSGKQIEFSNANYYGDASAVIGFIESLTDNELVLLYDDGAYKEYDYFRRIDEDFDDGNQKEDDSVFNIENFSGTWERLGDESDYRFIFQFYKDNTFDLIEMFYENGVWDMEVDPGLYKITGNVLERVYYYDSEPIICTIQSLTDNEMVLLYDTGSKQNYKRIDTIDVK